MWGFHDRLLTLRKALHAFLSSGECASAIYRRWRWESHLQNLQFGLTLSEREWQDEWRSVLRLASSEPRHGSTSASSESSMSTSSSGSSSGGGGTTAHAGRRWSRLSVALGDAGADTHTMYESLEEVHVLALAHILRRPIIVVADTVLKVGRFTIYK
jgi:OTU domain-containing protein 7